MTCSRSTLFICIFAALAFVTTGCGDDDVVGDGGTDAGGTDAGRTDGGGIDSGVSDGGVGMDSGVVRPLPECDPFDATSCADGTKCKFVIWDPTDADDDTVLFYGCVAESIPTHSEGALCRRSNDITPLDPDDTLFTDDCDTGMFCWTSLDDSYQRCRRLCGDDRVECETDQFCLTVNSEPLLGICDQASPCDPVYQVGCPDSEACYVVRNTYEDIVGRCLSQAVEDGGVPTVVGDPCTSLDGCPRGSMCTTDILADGGMGDMPSCHAFCASGMGTDGGVPDDGGGMDGGVVFTGTCVGAETCVEIPLDMGTSRVPTPTGVCQ